MLQKFAATVLVIRIHKGYFSMIIGDMATMHSHRRYPLPQVSYQAMKQMLVKNFYHEARLVRYRWERIYHDV